MDTDYFKQIIDWQQRGWMVKLLSVREGWAIVVESPDSFLRDIPTANDQAMGIRFNTAWHATPQEAIRAAAEVLR